MVRVTREISFVTMALLGAGAAAQQDVDDVQRTLVDAAIERLSHEVTYDGAYQRLDYPLGDVPDNVGVCTDLVVRAYRGVGIDLQQLVHEDMQADFAVYPQLWGLARPDSNIDHRRVPNLQVFFERHGESLEPSSDGIDYRPGDIVSWMLPGNLPHIGIVSNEMSDDGLRPLVIHNIGDGPKMDDRLLEFPITGHYRYNGVSTFSQTATVFTSNYDVRLTVNGVLNHAQSRARVRAGHTIPVEFQRHKLNLTISPTGTDQYAVNAALFKRTASGWLPVVMDIPALKGDLGSPMSFTSKANGIKLDVALVVGLASH